MGLGPPFPIVINQGIAAGSPFTVGDIALITGAAPPTIGNSIMSQQVDGAVTYVAVSASTIGSGATETFRTSGGIISLGTGSESVILGQGATASGLGGVAIGFSASTSSGVAVGVSASTSFSAVAIGNGASAGGTSGSNGGVAIGFGATAPNGGGGSGGIAIGTGANAPSRTTIAIGGSASDSTLGNNVLIGASTSSTKQNFVGVGYSVTPGDHKVIVLGASATAQFGGPGAVVIGASAQSGGFTDSVALGHGTIATAASQFIVGGTADSATGITVMIVGQGDTNAAPAAVTHRISNATGSNIAGANYIIQPGLGTGTGTPGAIVMQVSPTTGSGSTLQTPTPILSVFNGMTMIGDTIANFANIGASAPLLVSGSARIIAAAGIGTQVLARVDGSFGSPTAVVLNDVLGLSGFGGFVNGGVSTSADIRATATENWSNTAHGTKLALFTTPNTTTTETLRQLWEQDGSITMLATAGSYGGGSRVLFLGNAATNPSSNPTAGGILYVNAGALTYRGSSGTVTVLGPA